MAGNVGNIMWLVYDLNPIPNQPKIEIVLNWYKNNVDVDPILVETRIINVLDRYVTAQKIIDEIKKRSEDLDRGLVRFQQIQTEIGFAPSSRTKIT